MHGDVRGLLARIKYVTEGCGGIAACAAVVIVRVKNQEIVSAAAQLALLWSLCTSTTKKLF